jgi:hypothetical protein
VLGSASSTSSDSKTELTERAGDHPRSQLHVLNRIDRHTSPRSLTLGW